MCRWTEADAFGDLHVTVRFAPTVVGDVTSSFDIPSDDPVNPR